MDDIFLALRRRSNLDNLKSKFKKEFKMKDMDSFSNILGIKIRRNRVEWKLLITQHLYFDKILNKFGMVECKLVNTPLA